jgi:hypothetical protein
MRWPLEFVLLYEWLLSGIAFICNALAGNFILHVIFVLQKRRISCRKLIQNII